MNSETFNAILETRISQIRETLQSKATEYVRNNDRLHNFNTGARITGETREKVLWGFALKHFISIQDLIGDLERGTPRRDRELSADELAQWEEKIGDLINYLILLEASVAARYNPQP